MKIYIPKDVVLSDDITKEFKKALTKDFFFSINGKTYIIPKGFRTDGASIPWWLIWLYNRFDPDVLNSAVIHDWFYYNGFFTRARTDKIFLACMRYEKVRPSKRRAFYRAVRLFASKPWNKYRKALKKKKQSV